MLLGVLGAGHDQLIDHWGVTVAPTVLFFGRGALKLVERMQRDHNPDYCGVDAWELAAHGTWPHHRFG